MDLVELGAVLADFFEDGKGPSHDQLDQAFARAGLSAGDPAPGGRNPSGSPLGKMKRLRAVFVYATDHDPDAGSKLARQIVALLRADGTFNDRLSAYAGAARTQRLKEAFRRIGFELDATGALRPLMIDNLSGTELTAALRAYIDRINANPHDAPLQVGTGKDLDEATARHVLEQKLGSYSTHGTAASFPYILAQAFTLAGYSVPGTIKLDSDPRKAVHQSLFLLATQVNRLRNEMGAPNHLVTSLCAARRSVVSCLQVHALGQPQRRRIPRAAVRLDEHNNSMRRCNARRRQVLRGNLREVRGGSSSAVDRHGPLDVGGRGHIPARLSPRATRSPRVPRPRPRARARA